MGRPSKYTQELVDEICDRLSKGEPLAQICRDEGMPCHATLWNWMHDRADNERAASVSEAIARARELGEEVIASDCLRIADTPQEGVEITTSEKGIFEKRGDMLGHRRLQIDTRLKLLAKWNPKKWGDRIDHTSGGDKIAAQPIHITREVITGK